MALHIPCSRRRVATAWWNLALMALLVPPVAQAATGSVDVPVQLSVNAPVCTVANQNPSIALTAASPGQTWAQFLSASGITTAAYSHGWSSWEGVTSSALNQTATITCSHPGVPIQSVVVQPGSSAYVTGAGGTGMQFLVDATTPTPQKMGGRQVFAEQVSANGSAALHLYINTSWDINPYLAGVTTGALSGGSSTATVVWRPVFANSTHTAAVGSPAGGSYSAAFRVVVNY